MDIPRHNIARAKRRKRIILGLAGLLMIAAVTLALARLEPAAPSVERAQLWTGTVERGEMLRQVRGNGSLVPEDIVWIATINSGRVKEILVRPGAEVKADTVLVELTSPDVEQAAFDAEWALQAAESELANLKAQLQTQKLNLEAAVATAEANHNNAKLEYEVNEALAKDGLVPTLVLRQTRTREEESAKLLTIEQDRLRMFDESERAQLAVQDARGAQLRAQRTLKQQHAEALKIRAGLNGVLQRLGENSTLQVGQQLAAGANVARVADPNRLKAEVRIYETQAKDVQLGLIASIDTRNGVVPGRVVRIDPAVENGTVTIDVALEGPLPRGARPDLTVEGTIQIERLQDVLHVGKPVGGNSDTTISLFRLSPNKREAKRIPVHLGRSSVNTIEVLSGLNLGDEVILSDMSAWDAHDRLRIN